MLIGRFARVGGEGFWAVVDPRAGSAAALAPPFESWAAGAARGDVRAGAPVPLAELTPLVPLEPGARALGVGMNYPTHLDDSGTALPVPEHMVGFIKLAESLIPHGATMRHPPSEQLDFEAEIVCVLAGPLPAAGDATNALLGYTLGNDTSVRDAPRPGGMVDLFTIKAQDATTPVGPWIATLDAVGGAGQPAIAFELRVNGESRQHDDSANMLWSVDRLLRSLDARCKLRAGDLVFTGTTGNTGMRDGRFLAPGDVVELEAEAIGVLRNVVGPRELAA